MSTNRVVDTYPRKYVMYHWISAALILMEWPIGEFGVNTKAETTATANMLHIWLGLIIFVITIGRVIAHMRGPRVSPLDMPAWEFKLFRANHALLYVSLLGAALMGVLMLVVSGQLPPFTGSAPMSALSETIPGKIHAPLAVLLMLMLIMHVAGVIYYQVKNGKTLRRMGVPVSK